MPKLTEKQKKLLEHANVLAIEANNGCRQSKEDLLKMLNKHPFIKSYLFKKTSINHKISTWKNIKKHNRKKDSTLMPGVMTGLQGRTSSRTWRNTK
tara:strand:+ start:850 stop:1137 length:288 start_codon:yes stop_codon:yes gene_type:complete